MSPPSGPRPQPATPAPPSMPPTRPSHHRKRRVHRPGCRHLRLCSDGDAPRLHRRRHLPQRPVLLHPRDGGQRRHPSGHSEGGYALAHADGTPVDLGTEPSFSPSPAPIRSAARCRWWPTPTTSAADVRAAVAAAMPAPTTARYRTATLRCRFAPCAASPTALPSRTAHAHRQDHHR